MRATNSHWIFQYAQNHKSEIQHAEEQACVLNLLNAEKDGGKDKYLRQWNSGWELETHCHEFTGRSPDQSPPPYWINGLTYG